MREANSLTSCADEHVGRTLLSVPLVSLSRSYPPFFPFFRLAPRRKTHRTAGVAGFGYNVDTSSPTSTEDRGIDSGDSVDPEDTWWVAAAAGAGVGLGVVLLGAGLFFKFGKKTRPSVEPSCTRVDEGADETKAESS